MQAKCCCQFIQGVREEKYWFVWVPDDYRWQMMTNDDQWYGYEPLKIQWLNTHNRTCGNSWYATWYRLIAPSCETVPVGVRILRFQITRLGNLPSFLVCVPFSCRGIVVGYVFSQDGKAEVSKSTSWGVNDICFGKLCIYAVFVDVSFRL